MAVSKPFAVTLAFGAALTGYLIRPFWATLFLAGTIAVASYPLHEILTRWFRGRRHLAAALLTFSLLIFIIAPLASLVAIAVQEFTQGLQWARDSLGIESLREVSITHLPPLAQQTLHHAMALLHVNSGDLHEYAGKAVTYAQSVAPAAVSMSFGAVGATLFVLAAYYFFTVDGARTVNFLCRVSPLRATQTKELIEEFREVSSAALVGSLATSAIVGAVVAIGFAVTGVPHAVFFGIATVVAGFIPVVGSAIIWVPAAAVLAITGHLAAAIGLAVWCTVGVAVADNVIKPLLMRGKSEMHVGLLFLSLLGGLAMFGGTGIVAGPVIMAFFLALLRIYARDYITDEADGVVLDASGRPRVADDDSVH